MNGKHILGFLVCFFLGSLCMLILAAVYFQDGTLISGISNSGNRFDLEPSNAKQVATELAEKDYLKEISQSDVEEIYKNLIEKARQGDVDAACAVLQIARLKNTKKQGQAKTN